MTVPPGEKWVVSCAAGGKTGKTATTGQGRAESKVKISHGGRFAKREAAAALAIWQVEVVRGIISSISDTQR